LIVETTNLNGATGLTDDSAPLIARVTIVERYTPRARPTPARRHNRPADHWASLQKQLDGQYSSVLL